ncbi:MAG: hypothetical protein P8Y61_01150 [Gammaproteobacteria bacterium]
MAKLAAQNQVFLKYNPDINLRAETMARLFRDFSVFVLITLLLAVVINAAAWLYIKNAPGNDRGWKGNWQINPESSRGIELRKQIFSTDNEEFLRSLETEPNLRAHTVLSFTTGSSTPAYTVGAESIRYESGWTDKHVRQLLKANDTVFVLGGSTTFGHGVSGDDTVSAYLGRQNTKLAYLNFGINAYDSLREVDKLVYLLRQGYRPRQVIFIDALNDLTTFISTPYRSHDKPRVQGFLIDRGKPALIFGTGANMLLAFAYSLPITQLWYQLSAPELDVPYGSLDANRDPIDYQLMSFFYKNQFAYGDKNLAAVQDDWLQYYQDNIRFVQQLGAAFDFEAYFIFQPFGVVEPDNPFLLPSYNGSIGQRIPLSFTQAMGAAIAAGELDMIDCQDAFSGIDKSKAFVDATHYSPTGNEALARCILSGIEARR